MAGAETRAHCRREGARGACVFHFLLLFEPSWPVIGLNAEPSVSFIRKSGTPSFGESAALLISSSLAKLQNKKKFFFFLKQMCRILWETI